MDIHEYQAKELLSEFGVTVPQGGLAYSPAQAVYRARGIEAENVLVKAQIHSGARSAAGGVIHCSGEDEIRKAADELMGKCLVTRQTGPAGQIVHRLYVEEQVEAIKEYYVGFVLDRQLERVVVMASADGGMNIEDRYKEKPESLIRAIIEPAVGMQTFQARWIAFKLGIDKSLLTQMVTTLLGCYRAFRDLDATLVEINPLAVTADGQLVALDAKMSFDDNAMLADDSVKVILVNIFAGTNRCDWIAEGLVAAIKKFNVSIPVIVRLAGTNAKTGKSILEESGVSVVIAESMRDAAELAVQQVK